MLGRAITKPGSVVHDTQKKKKGTHFRVHFRTQKNTHSPHPGRPSAETVPAALQGVLLLLLAG